MGKLTNMDKIIILTAIHHVGDNVITNLNNMGHNENIIHSTRIFYSNLIKKIDELPEGIDVEENELFDEIQRQVKYSIN